jgi:hypothetical protein
MMKTRWVATVFLIGCSGGGHGFFPTLDANFGGGDMAGNTSPDLTSTEQQPDLTFVEPVPDLTSGGTCPAASSYGALGSLTGSPTQMGTPPAVIWQAAIDNNAKPTMLSLQLYAGSGAFSGLMALKTGNFPIAGDELNYQTCGVCLLVYTGVDMATGNYDAAYLATGGTVNLTSVSGALTGTISNATFQHVEIDPTTYQSTPSGDGCNSAVSSASFSDPITTM